MTNLAQILDHQQQHMNSAPIGVETADTLVDASGASDDPYVGRELGDLRIIGRLAEGGMATLYVAHDAAAGRCVVVKVLLPQLARDASIVQRFFDEAKAAQAIAHPGVVEIYEVDRDRHGRPYMAMEYVHGETLEARIKREGRLQSEDAVEIARQIADVLAAAHKAGIVHRDLKPENIILTKDAAKPGQVRVKLLDFGVAKLARPGGKALTRIGDILGTPLYMAPEQCRGDANVDHRVDLYALGCVLYTMLCGRPPFSSRIPTQVIYSHMNHPVAPPRMFLPGIEEKLEELVLGLLKKDPDERPQTADAVVEILEKLLDPAATAPAVSNDNGRETEAGGAKLRWKRYLVIAASSVLVALGGGMLLSVL